MDYKSIVNGIFNFWKNNLNNYIKIKNDKIELVDNFFDGDADVLQGGQINFYSVVDTVNFTELENSSELVEIQSEIVLILKLKKKISDVNDTIKEYVGYIYDFVKENNTFGNTVDYTKIENIEFYGVDEQSQFSTQIVVLKINYYKEIN